MSNRLKPRRTDQEPRPARPWQVTTRTASAGRPLQPAPGDQDFGDGVLYEPLTDRLVIETAPGCITTITPGRKFAEALARGFTALPATPPHRRAIRSCSQCGAQVIEAIPSDGTRAGVALDAEPNPNGVWLLHGDRHARLLRPMETPPGPTYAAHTCPAERSDP